MATTVESTTLTSSEKIPEPIQIRNPFAPMFNCKYFIDTNLQELLSSNSGSSIVFLEEGREGIYKIDYHFNIITIIPMNVTEKNNIPQHISLFYGEITRTLRVIHRDVDNITFNAFEYRLFFYFPESISLQGFGLIKNTARTAIGKPLPIEVAEYCRPIKIQNDSSPFDNTWLP